VSYATVSVGIEHVRLNRICDGGGGIVVRSGKQSLMRILSMGYVGSYGFTHGMPVARRVTFSPITRARMILRVRVCACSWLSFMPVWSAFNLEIVTESGCGLCACVYKNGQPSTVCCTVA
jgi:hypothetical protein